MVPSLEEEEFPVSPVTDPMMMRTSLLYREELKLWAG
jgi:hypothetical protein